jgi:TRAP-type C4-dicarboxylate transport system permease large subunit
MLSFFSFSLSSIFFVAILAISLYLGLSFDQILFILNENFVNLVTKPEVISVPFFLLSSELFLNAGFTKRFKEAVFSNFGNNLIGYLIYFLGICTTISSSVIFSKVLSDDFIKEEFGNKRSFVRSYFLLSAVSYVAPISIPLIIIASILEVSLKKAILISFSYTLILLVIYYFLLFNKNFMPKKAGTNILHILPVAIYFIGLYFLIYVISLPIDVISQILFLYTFILVTVTKKFKTHLVEISAKSAFIRTGIIVSVIYFINIFNFYSVYTNSTENLISNIAILFSESGFMLVLVYIMAFFLMDLIDPLGIILLLFPIYSNIINAYGLNKYAFLVSFLSFVAMALIGNIKELPGNIIREKLILSTFEINDIVLIDFLILSAISFGIYFIL